MATVRPAGTLGATTVARRADGTLVPLFLRRGTPTVVAPTPEPTTETVAATVRSVSTAQLGYGETTRTVGLPPGTTAGDGLLIVLSVDGGPGEALSLPAGFTELSRMPAAQTAGDERMVTGYRIADGTEPAALTFTTDAGADARVGVLAVADVDPLVAPVVVATTSSPSLIVHSTPPAYPPSHRNLAVFALAKDDDDAAQSWNWYTSLDNARELTDAQTNGWVTQTVWTSRWDTADQLPSRSFLVKQTGNGLASPAVVATILIPSGQAAPVASTYTAQPSLGTGGEHTDGLGVSFTANGVTSTYHRYAHGVDPAVAAPLVLHLHGDGGYEYDNPQTWTTPGYVAAGRSCGAIVLVPNTPDTLDSRTWWEDWPSTEWLMALIRQTVGAYNVDRRRVYLSGFSGGAVVTTMNLLADFAHDFPGGGAMLLGGGGPYTSASTTPSAATKSDFLLRWHVGELDDGRNTLDNYNARAAAEEGHAQYTAAGWNTALTLIPGADHLASEPYGPRLLQQLILESHTHYGL